MRESLFNYEIKDWKTWSKVFRSIDEFELLIKEILSKMNLKLGPIENCKTGTNGVFKVGKYIIKIFVPKEAGYNSYQDYISEVYSLKRANELGVSVPNLVASGEIADKYLFRYIVMEHIEGHTLGDIKNDLSDEEKIDIGQQLRAIVNL